MTTALPRTATLIVNAQSRSGGDAFEEARDLLTAGGIVLEAAHAVTNPKTLPSVVEKAVADGAQMVIVGGGDGSISSCVDFFAGKDAVFALLPLGTANSFARSLGIPVDLAGAVDVILKGRVQHVDLGMIDADYYANCAAIGLAPLIAETVPHWLKRWFGRLGYLTWVFIALTRFKPFVLWIDGERMDALEVRIANGSFQGGTELVESAEVTSGEIVVQVVPGRTRRDLIWSWIASVMKFENRRATIRDFHGKSLRIETRPALPISIDGEIAAHTPVTAHIAPRALRMVVPGDSGI